MPLIRLVPILPLISPLGPAEAHFYEWPEDAETNATYHTFQVETKEPWLWMGPLVRLRGSISVMRGARASEIWLENDLFETLRPHILRHTRSPFYERAKGAG